MKLQNTKESSASKESVIKHSFRVGVNTFISRMLGLVREVLLMRFLGVGVVADAFTTAFMLPNSLRKLFAEGALSAAFVPTFIALFKTGGKKEASRLMTLSFLVFECVLLLFCVVVMCKARATIMLIAPGYSESQVAATVPLLRILMPFIFFISASALLAGALQSVKHFFIPSFGQVLLNIVFVMALSLCLHYSLTVDYLCWSLLAAGFFLFLTHVIAYIQYTFTFCLWNKETFTYFAAVVSKFILCFLSMSIMEVNLFVDQMFASYLPVGSVTLIKYSSRFMGIPLGVFAVAFSTVLLPYFSNVQLHEPKNLNRYLNEAVKFVLWITLPVLLVLTFLSTEVFQTIFVAMSDKFPVHRVSEAGWTLKGFMIGLCFFSLGKILFSLFYALHDTMTPTFITFCATMVNIGANYYFVQWWQGFGLSLGTSLSGAAQMILSFYFLHRYYKFDLELWELVRFIGRYSLQLVVVFFPLYFLYPVIYGMFAYAPYGYFFTKSFGFWFWILPTLAMIYTVLAETKKIFGIKLFFLD